MAKKSRKNKDMLKKGEKTYYFFSSGEIWTPLLFEYYVL